jgi:hypothetical protein
MTRYAVPLLDLDTAWRTPAGSALVEAAVEDQEHEEAEVVTVEGSDALVLPGSEPQVAALVASLLATPLPLAPPRPARVYSHGPAGWLRVGRAPQVPVLPDDDPLFEDDEEEP